MMDFHSFPPSLPVLRNLAYAGVFLLLAGCYAPEKTADKNQDNVHPRWFVHCDTCAWCRGPYKTTQDAQERASEHNIKTHDYLRLAYYDTEKCSK